MLAGLGLETYASTGENHLTVAVFCQYDIIVEYAKNVHVGPFRLCDWSALNVDHRLTGLDVDAGLWRDGREGHCVQHRHQCGGAVSSFLNLIKVDDNEVVPRVHVFVGLDLHIEAFAIHLHRVDADVHKHFHAIIGFDAECVTGFGDGLQHAGYRRDDGAVCRLDADAFA